MQRAPHSCGSFAYAAIRRGSTGLEGRSIE